MKKALFIFAGLVLSSAAFADVEVELLNCASTAALGAPSYIVKQVAGAPHIPNSSFWTITEKPLNPMAQSKVETVAGDGRVVHIGNRGEQAFILSADLGKSGYVHLYVDPGTKKSLIDISTMHISTNGPLTEYSCTTAGHYEVQ
ncbi:MAG: hypothetical protein IPK68_11775 [Bdellovibrionales bacterium]|nr:hypothetical protein [Bdellovibrionales bacterium]